MRAPKGPLWPSAFGEGPPERDGVESSWTCAKDTCMLCTCQSARRHVCLSGFLRFDGRRLLPPPADTIVFSKRKHLTITRSFIIGRLARAALVLVPMGARRAQRALPSCHASSAAPHARPVTLRIPAWQASQHRAAAGGDRQNGARQLRQRALHVRWRGFDVLQTRRKFFVKTDGLTAGCAIT